MSAAAAALIFAVAACGPLPRPFKSGDAVEHPFAAIQNSVGVVVAPIAGAPPGVSGPLAELMAKSLRRADIPATTGSAIKQAYLLEGRAAADSPPGTVAIDWTVTDVSGAVVDSLTTRHGLAPSAWRAGTPQTLRALADAAVPPIVQKLQTALPVATAPDRPTLGVVSVAGAPGNGNEALKTAFEAVLRSAGLPVEADAAAAAIRIFGDVAVTSLAVGQEKVDIAWTLRAADGAELGVLTQTNTVQAGRLDTRWGALAYDVTYAVVASVVEVFRTIDNAERVRRR